MKKEFVMHKGREVRVMTKAEGWAMVRRRGAMPFCVPEKELGAVAARVCYHRWGGDQNIVTGSFTCIWCGAEGGGA